MRRRSLHLFRIVVLLIVIEYMIAFHFQYGYNNLINISSQELSSAELFVLMGSGILLLGLPLLLIVSLIIDDALTNLLKFLKKRNVFIGTILILLLVFYETFQDILFLQIDLPEIFYAEYRALLGRYLPLVVWIMVVSFQSIIFLVILNWKDIRNLVQEVDFGKAWFVIFATFLGIGMVLSLTGWGFIPRTENLRLMEEIGTFDPANAPLPGIHVGLLTVLSLGFLVSYRQISKRFPNLAKLYHNEWLIIAVLWFLSFLIWVQVPVEENYFIDVPEFASYPFAPTSDAFYFEKQAQQYLAGEGFDPSTTHAMYSFILSILHLLMGDGYVDILPLHIGILALTTVFFYKIGCFFSNRWGGIILAVFFLVREHNSLVLGNHITVANVQELLTESFTLLFLLAFLFYYLQWISSPETNRYSLLLSASVLGLAVLIRVEVLAVLIAVVILSLFIKKMRYSFPYKDMVIFFLVLGVMIFPWMTRNYFVMGAFAVDEGKHAVFEETIRSLAGRQRRPVGEAANDKNLMDNSQMFSMSKFEKPVHHLSNSLIHSVIYLPSNHQPFLTLGSVIELSPEPGGGFLSEDGYFSENYLARYVKSLPYWWYSWDGQLESRSILPLLFSLALIASGIVFSWKNQSFLTLLPIGAFAAHLSVYAIFGRSGSRFIKIVDWVPLLFFSLGIAGVLSNRITWGLPVNDHETREENYLFSWARWWSPSGKAFFSVLFVLMAVSMPILESMLPPQYTVDVIIRELEEKNESRVDQESWENQVLEEILSSDLPQFYGKALYPRYYKYKQEITDDRSGRLPRAYGSRIDFYLVGSRNIWVTLPLGDPSEVFPHGREVIVQGYLARDDNNALRQGNQPYIRASSVIIIEREEGRVSLDKVECQGQDCFP